MIANLKHAARNRETTTIGGGEFDAYELLAAEHMIEQYPRLLEALRAVLDGYQQHFDVMPVAWQTYDNIVREAYERAAAHPVRGFAG